MSGPGEFGGDPVSVVYDPRMSTVISLSDLRDEAMNKGQNPRVHPNGFIQLDLDPVEGSWHQSHKRGHSGAARRLHIWNPPGLELPHQGTVNEIHDHVFDMRSTVVRGMLIQQLYEFVVGGTDLPHGSISVEIGASALPITHEIYRAVYEKHGDSRLEPTGIRGTLRRVVDLIVREDECYTQPAFTLHDSEPGTELVVTVMEKMAIHDGDATVVCPADTPPDNSFDRASAAPADDLWAAIERSLS